MHAQTQKAIIEQEIDEQYRKIAYLKSMIGTIAHEIDFFQKESDALSLKMQYPLPNQKEDLAVKLDEIKLKANEYYMQIWEHRTEVLKVLLKLQYLTNMQILSL